MGSCLLMETLNMKMNPFRKIDALTKAIHQAYSHFHLRKATQLIMEIAQEGNVYFDGKNHGKMRKEWEQPLPAV